MSLVSVCVPLYNGEKYLRESLDSIVNQSYQELEILVLNDCSTDGSISIIKEYQEKDDRIRLIHNEQNLGLIGNWNKCISEATGDYIKLHFQDDLMLVDTIEKMVTLAEKETVEVVLTDREYYFEHQVNFYPERLSRLSDHFHENTIIDPSFIADLLIKIGVDINFMGEPIIGLVKRNVFDAYGVYDDTFKQIADFEFWLRLGMNLPIGFIPEKLHTFRLHYDSQSQKNAKGIINPTHVDRIHLASKMNDHKSFLRFREIVGTRFSDELLRDYVISYTRRYGKEKLAKHINEKYFLYLPVKNSRWKQLIKSVGRKRSSFFD